MLKDLISKQKEQKERLLLLPYIKRNKIDQADKWNKSGLIKVILGVKLLPGTIHSCKLLTARILSFLLYRNLPTVGSLGKNAP